MRTVQKLIVPALALGLMSTQGPLALAGDQPGLAGNEILKKAEMAMNAPADRVARERMSLIDSGGTVKERVMEVYQKGSDMRLVVFRAPAEVNGVGFLSLSGERMYLYLPAFRKVRRVASSAKNENFMGTDFSYEDMAETLYTKNFTAKLAGGDDGNFLLELTPRSGATVSYGRQKMWVDKRSFVPTRTEYYGKDGALLKVLTGEAIRQVDGYWFPTRLTMETIRSKRRTVLKMEGLRHNSGLSDSFFAQRNLKKLGR